MGSFRLVDTAIVNGKVMTLDPRNSLAEAVAIRDGRILFVGSSREVTEMCGSGSKVIDAGGRVILPGFIDTHTHPSYAGMRMTWINCVSPPNTCIDDILTRVVKEVKKRKPGEWILGEGYNIDRVWEKDGRHINRWDIDKVAPQNPVRIWSVGGHPGSIYNSYALNMAGIDHNTPDPEPPSLIARDEKGCPTGLLSGDADQPLVGLIPEPTLEDRKQLIILAGERYRAWGVTTIHDAYVHPKDIEVYQSLFSDKRLPARTGMLVAHMVHPDRPLDITGKGLDVLGALESISLKQGFGNEWLWIEGAKIFADGAFTESTAAMSEPYIGLEPSAPSSKGFLHDSQEYLHDRICRAHRAGLRPCIHAQGDYGIEVALDGIQKALEAWPATDHRIRIEHAGLTPPRILEHMRDLGVCVSSSISFLGGDVGTNWVFWGKERMEWTYALRSLGEYGIVAAANGDYPVTDGNPMLAIGTAVTRRAVTGDLVGLSQAIPVLEALRHYTSNAAYLEFGEEIKGTLEPGKLADLVVLGRDPTAVPHDEIRDIKVDLTILAGEVVFER